ncbi:hypothetical protein C8D88_11665 [Lentzea atacamensis]|uniref:Uncharacterized protein n=1 Tax=Lentzea atacamensis TaxID=531938 RepID=A0A316HMV7_9PSEU|nr:hypothetical protein [Lentzea atacamensis]PWK81654.1 hypothetical protein C8D88_11665 [Lentzea atacamensis]
MVVPQVTHTVQSSHGDSVRITAEQKLSVLREFFTDFAVYKHAVTLEARAHRDSLTARHRTDPESVRPYQIDEANRQLLAARTVEQDVRATLAAFGENRDF